jgi:integrase/recombinase XerC
VGRLDLLAEYEAHLEHSPLASSTRVAYRRQTRGYLEWLARRSEGIGDVLTDPHGRDFAVRDYRSSLKERRLGPASVNAALAAIDHLYRFLRLGPPSVRREALPAQAPRSLCAAELAGHRSLETTRRYVLPTQADLAAAVERSTVEA